MDHDLRTRLSAADPAGDRTPDRYTPEHQQQLIEQIMSEAGDGLIQAPGRRRVAVPLSAAAAVLVATGITAAVAMHSPATGGPAAAGANVTQRLDDIAQVAAVHSNVSVGKDQYLYTRIVEAGSEMTLNADGVYTAGPLPAVSTRDTWSPQDPTKKGLFREGHETTVINPELGGPSTDQLTYAQIATLPTDPATLLKQVTASLPDSYRDDQDHGAFTDLLGYLQEAPPPAVAQAIYRAAAMIPGVHLREDAVDALGRHGVGLSHDETRGNLRDEYIVDPDSARYLGQDQYVIRDGAGGRAGQHIATEALLQTGVVDRIGRRPAP